MSDIAKDLLLACQNQPKHGDIKSNALGEFLQIDGHSMAFIDMEHFTGGQVLLDEKACWQVVLSFDNDDDKPVKIVVGNFDKGCRLLSVYTHFAACANATRARQQAERPRKKGKKLDDDAS